MDSVYHLQGYLILPQVQYFFPKIYKQTGSRIELYFAKVPFGRVSVMKVTGDCKK